MDKRLSEKEQKMLLDALERAKEDGRKMREKEEQKRWSEMELPFTLSDFLTRFTKEELSTIRTKLGIPGVSALRKQELIYALVDHIPEAVPSLLNKLDEARYKIIKHIAGRGGHAFVPLESHQHEYFRDRGLIFTGTYKGKKMLAIPKEVLQCFQSVDTASYRETVRRNTDWIKLTLGMLFYYGNLDLNNLVNLVKSHTGSDVRIRDYLMLLQESLSFYETIRFDANGFSNSKAWDVEKLKTEQKSRPDMPFYPFTKAQLMLAGDPDFIDRNPSHRAFVNFITYHYSTSREETDYIVEECADAFRIGESPGAVLQFLQSQLEMEDEETINAFMDHLVMLHNQTRQWILKGYTPNELFAAKNPSVTLLSPGKTEVIDFAARKKIGRNDPCPCGSGKKYKKCCGA